MICRVRPLSETRNKKLEGIVFLPGDKSISHRALFFGLLNRGRTEIRNLLESEDTRATMIALEFLGARVKKERRSAGKSPESESKVDGGTISTDVTVESPGLGNLSEPDRPIDCMNSGTTARVLAGILAGEGLKATITGDASLSRRPMNRVVKPLLEIGAKVKCSEKGTLPVIFERRSGPLQSFRMRLEMPSAQVKTALFFASLYAEKECLIEEPEVSRDHTERMFALFDVPYERKPLDGGNGFLHRIEPVCGRNGSALRGDRIIEVPGDVSSAAFFLAALAILPEGSKIQIVNCGINPTRTGFLELLKSSGFMVEFKNEKNILHGIPDRSGTLFEPVADIVAESGASLRPFSVTERMVPTMIDEIPLLGLAGSQIKGKSSVSGARELRVKESDRISVLVCELRKMGLILEEKADGFTVTGPQKPRCAVVDSHNDHRIAMLLFLAGLIASEGLNGEKETVIRNMDAVKVSFPGFLDTMKYLGAEFELVERE